MLVLILEFGICPTGKRELNNRPELWWNDFDGMKVGWHFNGDYMNYHHQINSTIWVNTGLLQKKLDNTIANEYNAFSYRFNYKTGLDKWSKKHINYPSQSLS